MSAIEKLGKTATQEFFATAWMFLIFYIVPAYFVGAINQHIVCFFLVLLTGFVTGDAGMNPAISLALYSGSILDFMEALVAFLAQHLVSFFAVPMLIAVAPIVQKLTGGPLLTFSGPTIPAGDILQNAFIREASMTALFTMAVMATIQFEKSYFKSPWVARSFIAVVLRTITHFVGANMNPATSIAFYLHDKKEVNDKDFIAYVFGPLVGAVIGVIAWKVAVSLLKSRASRKRIGKKQ